MICLSNLLQREHCFTDIDIEECFIHDALIEISYCLTVSEETLLSLVMSRQDQLIARIPLLMRHFIEEAAMLHYEDLFDR